MSLSPDLAARPERQRSQDPAPFTRRAFLKTSALAGGGFLIGFALPSRGATMTGAASSAVPPAGAVGLTPWVRITPDNVVTLIVSQTEIGQGISTTLPALLAQELGADWSTIRLETSPFDPAYRNPARQWMFTGNSESSQAFHELMRRTGSAARQMLIRAAANRWGVPAESCRAELGIITHVPSARTLTFGEVAADAAKLPVPKEPVPISELPLSGRALARVDIPEKVDGSAQFGIDVRLPNMLVAAVRTAPTLSGRLRAGDWKIPDLPGVRAVVPLGNGVAVVADTYWQARSALPALPLEFDVGMEEQVSTEALRQEYRKRLEEGPWAHVVDAGHVDLALRGSKSRVSADYENPFLAHATMEPMNCTASVTADRCEIWAPTQGQELAFEKLKEALGLKGDQIQVNRSRYAGGGFGRRLLPDFVVQAALISKAVGRPVKVIWDREEDIRRDWYRPATAARLTAGLDERGVPSVLSARVVSPTILHPVFPSLGEFLKEKGFDPSALEGLLEPVYEFPNRRIDFHLLKTTVPTSVMRTTGYGPNIFALESFIDELAHAARTDRYRYRRRLLSGNARVLRVLDRAAALAGWGKPLPAGVGRGIAIADPFGSLICQVIEAEVRGSEVRVRRVTSVVDPGRVLDPGIARSNVEAGTVFGLSYCKSEITFEEGRVVQGNFDGYELPYLAECPDLTTEFLPSGGKLGGLGEVSPVTVAPALSNAIFAATGRRLRSMPLSRHGLRLGVVRAPKGKGYA